MARPVVLSAVRTPVGRYGGALAGVRPDDLAALVIAAAVERAGVAGERDRRRLLRLRQPGGRGQPKRRAHGALLAGLPESVAGRDAEPALRVGPLGGRRRRCHAIVAGDGDLFVAGGVESMSRAPLVMAKPSTRSRAETRRSEDTTLGWRFPNPRLEAMFPLESMGETGENVAERYGVSREEQDAFALQSQQRWAEAELEGRFEDEAGAGRRGRSGRAPAA